MTNGQPHPMPAPAAPQPSASADAAAYACAADARKETLNKESVIVRKHFPVCPVV